MNLSQKQLKNYNENGFIFFDGYLTGLEIDALIKEFPKTLEKDSKRIVYEDNGSVRSVFAPHFVNDTYLKLTKLKKLLTPVEQILNSKVYIHQYKINTKKGLNGDWWEWHQDFPYWHFDDGILKPDLISVLIYLQDTDSSNGALMLIPKTHKLGIVKTQKKSNENFTNETEIDDFSSSLSANIKYTVDHELLKESAQKNKIITVEGRKGTVIFFHGNIFHASNSNLSPFDRDAVIITYNSVYNTPKKNDKIRPDYLCGKNHEPIVEFLDSIN